MGGFFAATTKVDCGDEVFYGTDYQSHQGTQFGGLAFFNKNHEPVKGIHDIRNDPFRSKFESEREKLRGPAGIGVISDTDAQPLIINSSLGTYAIVTVGRINNIEKLAQEVRKSGGHFAEVTRGQISPTEMVAILINQGTSFVEGIQHAQSMIDGSCSLLILSGDGVYAARDRFGRTPVVLGRKDDGYAAAIDSCAFFNLGYEIDRFLGPGEIVFLQDDFATQLQPAWGELRICAFLWVYYGFPASDYEGINVEETRYRCGAALARADGGDIELDMIAGIPDSGIGHAIGYANQSRVPYMRPFVKYTPTWPRSFMPQDQQVRDLVARMKLIPIPGLARGKKILFCEDSIVRGTQLKKTIKRLKKAGAKEIHMRPACPPLIFGCQFLNFSRSRAETDLAGRQAIEEIIGAVAGRFDEVAPLFADPRTAEHAKMVEKIQKQLGLTTLRYQLLGNLVSAIDLPKKNLCTYCWDGCG